MARKQSVYKLRPKSDVAGVGRDGPGPASRSSALARQRER